MVPIEAPKGSFGCQGLEQHSLLLRTLRLLLLAIVVLWPVSASLVSYPPIDLSGTGYGTVNEILTFLSVGTGPDMSAGGCVRWGGPPGFGDVYGGGCPTVTLGNLQDNSKSHTVTPGDVGVLSPLTLAIVLDAAEPGGDKISVVVSQLILTFYGPTTGDVLYTAELSGSVTIPNDTRGSGLSGYVFGLDHAQAVAAQESIRTFGYAFNEVRIGLGAELQQFDGHAYFWIGDIPGGGPPEETPEPATFLMIGGGLLALGFAGRRFRRG